jgi:hypothetical protein
LNLWIDPILGLAEVALLLVAVYLTIAQFTRSRASSYIERFNSSDAMESRVAVDRWLKEHGTTKARLEALDEDPALRTHLRRFANLFQELGAAYQFGVAHRKTVRVLFDALVVMYWEQLRFWVHDYRAQADPTLYARFEYLYREIKARQPRARNKTDYVVAYGSLMDPVSLGAGLGRAASDGELIPISLHGWARRWSIGELVRLGSDSKPMVAAFLDVEPRAAVWCFVGKDEHRVDRTDGDAVILQSYLDRVAAAARRIDPSVEADVRTSAAHAGLEFAEGPYEFVDADQAALV